LERITNGGILLNIHIVLAQVILIHLYFQLPLELLIYIWKINNAPASLITYLAIGRVFDRLSFSEIQTILQSYINRGGLSRFLLLPTSFFGYMIADNIGFNLIRSIINSIIIFGFALIVFNGNIIFSINIFYLICYFIITYLIKSFLGFLTGSIGFWLNDNANARAIVESVQVASGLLSGEIIPLFVLFSGFMNPIFWTPFAFLFHHPMQIYLGKYNSTETLLVFAGGIIWCIILYFLAKFVFKKGLKRNEAVGL
jgi:ABC-2 type transport system permease protein